MSAPLTEARAAIRLAYIRRERGAGVSWRTIARALDLGEQYVREWAIARGVRSHQPHRHAGDQHGERLTLIVASRLSGDTLEDIGERHGISRERVRQILKRAGIGERGLRGFEPFDARAWRFRYPNSLVSPRQWKRFDDERARRREAVATLRDLAAKLGRAPTHGELGEVLGVTGANLSAIASGTMMRLGRLFLGRRSHREPLKIGNGMRRLYRLAGVTYHGRGTLKSVRKHVRERDDEADHHYEK